MNQTRTNYQQFINDIYTSQKHILGLVTKLAQRMDDLEARLRDIKDDQNLHLSAVKNSLDELRGEIRHQYTEEADEIDELNDVLAGELENLDMMTPSIMHSNSNANGLSKEQAESYSTAIYEGQITNLDELVNSPNNNNDNNNNDNNNTNNVMAASKDTQQEALIL